MYVAKLVKCSALAARRHGNYGNNIRSRLFGHSLVQCIPVAFRLHSCSTNPNSLHLPTAPPYPSIYPEAREYPQNPHFQQQNLYPKLSDTHY
ncbi:hypothetical protein RB195_002605 [Necator americanus]|uniref:Uncharacterized protein n=1 Tax=Necator americanus TaxID=51031 RepID=A0ABR1DL87_NECAM